MMERIYRQDGDANDYCSRGTYGCGIDHDAEAMTDGPDQDCGTW
jgi:hypothetical protein